MKRQSVQIDIWTYRGKSARSIGPRVFLFPFRRNGGKIPFTYDVLLRYKWKAAPWQLIRWA